MATTTLEGADVLSGVVVVPRVGRWTARLVVDADKAPAGRVTLSMFDSTFSLVGAVARSGLTGGHVEALLVGGAGGLANEIGPKAYLGGGALTAKMVAGDILETCGETLSTSSTGLDVRLAGWTRIRGAGGACLAALANELGLTWRTLADGTVWLGSETWPASKAVGERLRDFPEQARATYAIGTGAFLAGETFDSRRVERVEHNLRPSGHRTEIFTA